MKRTIKFRGKCVINGEWVCGFLADGNYINDTNTIDLSSIEVDSDTVGSFTGFCDASGKEIYEGDILRELGSGKLVEVIYDAPEFCFKDNVYGYRFLNHPENFEVIGNIYDNSDYLKGGEE